ncbi:general stress protein [bacterium]|nr:general stress protein [bacterium]
MNSNNPVTQPVSPAPVKKSTRGFASMDPARQREIARKGGRAAHLKGTAHEFTPDEARVAGRKGGQAVSRDRAHMAMIGREGGQARGAKAARLAAQQQQLQQQAAQNGAVKQAM